MGMQVFTDTHKFLKNPQIFFK